MKTFYEKCAERSQRLMNIAIHTNQTYETLRQVQTLQNEKNKIINLSVAFYRTVIRNCIQDLFIEITKMFSPEKKSEGVKSLLDTMRENMSQVDVACRIEINWFSDFIDFSPKTRDFVNVEALVKQMLQEIEAHRDVINNVRKQRNKYYAHLDLTAAGSADFFSENMVTYKDLKELLLLNTNICNALYMYFHQATMMPLVTNYDDLKQTVFYVEKGLEHK